MARICGNCKSSDIKQIGAIRAQLSQDNSSTTLGIGLLSGGGGLGGAKTSGTSAPKLIKSINARTPKQPGIGRILFFILFAALMFGVGNQQSSIDASGQGPDLYYFIGFILIILIIFAIRGRIKYKSKLELFNRTWYCFSCGQFRIFKK